MDDASSQPRKSVPARGDGRPAAHKAYASKNDVAVLDAPRHPRAPQTPKKPASGSPAPADANPGHTGSKQRSRNVKPRPKNVPTSPDSAQRGRQTPPHRSVSMKPGNGAAFAGATFHASPAPSALPIPSFFAKASSDSPVHGDARDIAQEPSPPATDIDAPTPFRPSSVPRNHESPLDFMFRVHREEKERQHRGVPIAHDSNSPEAASPPSHAHSDPRSISPSSSNVPQGRRSFARRLSGGIHGSELDGTAALPMGPAFSTPYQDRIRAARSNASRPQPTSQRQAEPSPKTLPTEDPAEALKKFLFGGGSDLGKAVPETTAASVQTVQTGGRTPSSSTAKADRQEPVHASNIQALENDLRRILKLDLTSHSPSSGR